MPFSQTLKTEHRNIAIITNTSLWICFNFCGLRNHIYKCTNKKHLPFDRNKKVCLQIRIQIKHVANDKGVRGRTKQHHCRHKSASNGPRDASALGKSSSKKIAAYRHHHHQHCNCYYQHRNHHRQHNHQLQMVGCSPGRLNLTWALAGQGWTKSCLVSIIKASTLAQWLWWWSWPPSS